MNEKKKMKFKDDFLMQHLALQSWLWYEIKKIDISQPLWEAKDCTQPFHINNFIYKKFDAFAHHWTRQNGCDMEV